MAAAAGGTAAAAARCVGRRAHPATTASSASVRIILGKRPACRRGGAGGESCGERPAVGLGHLGVACAPTSYPAPCSIP